MQASRRRWLTGRYHKITRWTLPVLVALTAGGLALAASPADATFAGENGQIAFRRFLTVDQTWGAVFTIRPNGTGERQATHPPQGFVDRNPDVSPDGRRIVFEREGVDCGPDCSYDEIFVVNADGSNLTQLTHNPPGLVCGTGGFCNGSPAWSPDGTQIAFSRASGLVADDLIESVGIYVMDSDGSGVRQITQNERPALGEDSDPQWSPNGREIVFQRFNVRTATPADGVALWIVDLTSGAERRVSPWDLRGGDTPDWSPDGRQILFHSNVDGPQTVSANLYTVRPDGTQLRQLTFAEGGVTQYLGSSYSPDGRMITFGRKPETGGTAADVFVMRVDGTHMRQVTRTVLYDSYPDWGPDPEQD
jgi:Tol biopolymer transport system component